MNILPLITVPSSRRMAVMRLPSLTTPFFEIEASLDHLRLPPPSTIASKTASATFGSKVEASSVFGLKAGDPWPLFGNPRGSAGPMPRASGSAGRAGDRTPATARRGSRRRRCRSTPARCWSCRRGAAVLRNQNHRLAHAGRLHRGGDPTGGVAVDHDIGLVHRRRCMAERQDENG